jgi:hypothetical protein
MKLSQQDVKLYYKLMTALLLFTNEKFNLYPEISIENYMELANKKKLRIRKMLYENMDTVINDFVHKNPENFSNAELEIVKKWVHFVADDFIIERLLKKYAVFINDDKVYGVQALYESFDEVLSFSPLPIYTKAVLLPFKGKIIYDGLLESYAIYFGSNISEGIKETYMKAKYKGEIIESLDPDKPKRSKPQKPPKDRKPEIEELLSQVQKLRAVSGEPFIFGAGFSLVKASMNFINTAVQNPDDFDGLWNAFEKVEQAVRKVERTLYRIG